MKLTYDAEHDQLYIQLKEGPAKDTVEIADGFIADVAADGSVIGLDVEYASRKLDLTSLETVSLPLARTAAVAA